MHVAAETEFFEIIEQVWLEPAGAFEPGDLVRRKTEIFQKIQSLLQPRRQQEAASRRQSAGEKFEHRRVRVAMVQIGLGHVELVEVGEQRADRVFHRRNLIRPRDSGGGDPSCILPRDNCVWACELLSSSRLAAADRAARQRRTYLYLPPE